MNKGLRIGITGQSGGGKTSVATLLASYGFHVIDADMVARIVVNKGKPALEKLVEYFGEEILLHSGEMNRPHVAKIVFHSKEKKEAMQEIIFPFIIKEIDDQINAILEDGAPCVFLDAPTLFESGSATKCNLVISVIAPRELRYQRIVKRDGLTQEQANARLDSQQDDDYYRTRSQYTIENKGTLDDLTKEVRWVLQDLDLSQYIKTV